MGGDDVAGIEGSEEEEQQEAERRWKEEKKRELIRISILFKYITIYS